MKPCKNGATCIDKDNDYQCDCVPGYAGKDCENDIDECANKPCQNGECVNMINSFLCVCPDEYNGTLCEIMKNVSPSDFCASNPCQNGGTCELSDEWFTCKCATGFKGSNCGINIDECSSNPCTEGSTCEDDLGTFRCVCPPNRLGKRCEICEYTHLIIITYSLFFSFFTSDFHENVNKTKQFSLSSLLKIYLKLFLFVEIFLIWKFFL
jgi:hypothetical protein